MWWYILSASLGLLLLLFFPGVLSWHLENAARTSSLTWCFTSLFNRDKSMLTISQWFFDVRSVSQEMVFPVRHIDDTIKTINCTASVAYVVLFGFELRAYNIKIPKMEANAQSTEDSAEG